MAAGETKKKPAAAPKKALPPKSDAYLQLSPWLPATVCLMPPVPKPLPYICSVVPLHFKHGKEKVPKPHLGLFDHTKKDDRKQLAGIRVPPRKSSRSRPPSREVGVDKDDPSEYGWKEADPSGIVRYRRKLGEGRVFEFRAREGLRTGKALAEAIDSNAWDGRFM